jgi:hypothetical protein
LHFLDLCGVHMSLSLSLSLSLSFGDAIGGCQWEV